MLPRLPGLIFETRRRKTTVSQVQADQCCDVLIVTNDVDQWLLSAKAGSGRVQMCADLVIPRYSAPKSTSGKQNPEICLPQPAQSA